MIAVGRYQTRHSMVQTESRGPRIVDPAARHLCGSRHLSKPRPIPSVSPIN